MSSSDLLARALAELVTRRGNTDLTAADMKRAGRDIEAAGWQCRAAGLAEAIAVVQMFMESERANTEVSSGGKIT